MVLHLDPLFVDHVNGLDDAVGAARSSTPDDTGLAPELLSQSAISGTQ